MKAILVKPNQKPRIVEIPNDLTTFQQIVDGFIEPVYIAKDTVALVNDEGIIKGMSPNFSIGYQTLVGPALIVRQEQDKDEFDSLTDPQIKEVFEIVQEGRF